jgi:hypothetical protein
MGKSRKMNKRVAPIELGAHAFRIEIPDLPTADVVIIEEFGTREETRAVLRQRAWEQIADVARDEFNARFKLGNWRVGTNRLDWRLGGELCVLAWAAEQARDDELSVISARWAALRPEERVWLFMKTAAEAGRAEDRQRGWRRALHAALSYVPYPHERVVQLSLFA